MTQEELAKRIYVSKSAIAKWETDGGIPDRNNLYKLAEVIQVPIEDLYHVISGGKQPEVNLNINITTEI
ncbi:MAG: helix-turn-helix domain-containing protein, partial [Eubacterium sp.]|nr:helix-turn-helix domain-containing protein [Eubacterium sp.]